MEAKELMIGDWVKIKDQSKLFPMRIVAEHFVRSLDDFEPIPLTNEILHTNGALQAYDQFTIALDDKHILFLFYKPDCYMVCIDEREGNTAFDLVRRLYIKYVHELQHILRVAGYKEFADNIKLE